jgi:hypothetical protein
MRKIYQAVPDVPQVVANKAIEIVERHLNALGVRRAEELPEENKVRLMRELQVFFMSEFPHSRGKDGELIYDWSSHRAGGPWRSIVRWFKKVFHAGSIEPEF